MFGEISVAALFICFLLGGSAIEGGIFAAFPAVVITAVMIVSIHSGTKQGSYIAKGSVYGMIGGVCCAITVLLALQAGMGYVFSVVVGLVTWLISYHIYEQISLQRQGKTNKNENLLYS